MKSAPVIEQWRSQCHRKSSSCCNSFWVISHACLPSASTSCPGSRQPGRSTRTAPSPLFTASVSSDLSFFFPASSAPIFPPASPRYAAWGDFATGVLALLALLTVRVRPLFWFFVVAFNLVGAADLVVDYYHAIRAGLPALAGQFGATYAIPILYVPALMITHIAALISLQKLAVRRPATA